jgi:hypothetical protein
MGFERPDCCFGSLGAALQRRLAGLGGAPGATLGQEVGLPHPAALSRCLALLDHSGVETRTQAGRPGRSREDRWFSMVPSGGDPGRRPRLAPFG